MMLKSNVGNKAFPKYDLILHYFLFFSQPQCLKDDEYVIREYTLNIASRYK
jgi:hypothetical protein